MRVFKDWRRKGKRRMRGGGERIRGKKDGIAVNVL
jgi:hypothetical protein